MTSPQFTIEDVIPPEMLACATAYEAQIFADMEVRRKQMLSAKFEDIEYSTGTGISLRVVIGGRS